MRETKTIKDYSEEINKILKEEHDTDIPIQKINGILKTFCFRIIESMERSHEVHLRKVLLFHIPLYVRVRKKLNQRRGYFLYRTLKSLKKASNAIPKSNV